MWLSSQCSVYLLWKLKPFNLAKLIAQFHQRSALISRRQTRRNARRAAQNLIKGVRLWAEICVFAVRRECVRNKLSHASKCARASVTFRLALCCACVINNLILPQPVTRLRHTALQFALLQPREPRHTFDGFWTPIRFNYISPLLSLSSLFLVLQHSRVCGFSLDGGAKILLCFTDARRHCCCQPS